MFSMGRPSTPTMPNPDGAFSTAADRQQIDFLYAGITATAPPGTIASLTGLVRLRPHLGGWGGLRPYLDGSVGLRG